MSRAAAAAWVVQPNQTIENQPNQTIPKPYPIQPNQIKPTKPSQTRQNQTAQTFMMNFTVTITPQSQPLQSNQFKLN